MSELPDGESSLKLAIAELDWQARHMNTYRDAHDRMLAKLFETRVEVGRLRLQNEELDFLRHEGGPKSVAAMEQALKAAIVVMRHTAAEYLDGVMISRDPATIARAEWAEIEPDLEAILTAEACVGRADDDEDRERLWLNPILDSGAWRKIGSEGTAP